jgi:hypothetical protein
MILDDNTFKIIATRNYDFRKSMSVEEFESDLHRFKYIGRLMRRYKKKDELKTRLILNHIIILYNCFGSSTTNMLFMRLEEYHEVLKPFVLFLNFLPEKVEYKDKVIYTVDIAMDSRVVKELREI